MHTLELFMSHTTPLQGSPARGCQVMWQASSYRLVQVAHLYSLRSSENDGKHELIMLRET